MFPKNIRFQLNYDTFNDKWVLYILSDHSRRWVVKEWDRKPTQEVVDNVKFLIVRGMEIYHNEIYIPSFHLKGMVI